MDVVKLSIEERDGIGTRNARRMRHEGYVPGIVYGKGMENIPVKMKKNELRKTILEHGQNAVFNIEVGEEISIPVIIKDVQRDHFRTDYLHVDFQKIALDEKREAKVPVHLAGKQKAEATGGVVLQQLSVIEVECLPQDVPEMIEINVSELNVGDTFLVSHLALPPNVTIINDGDEVIASVIIPRNTADDVKEDTPANSVPIIGNDERETKAT